MTLYEAWPGYWRANRGNPVHVVDWPADRRHGHALCGRELEHVALYSVGWASHVGVERCGRCEARLAERRGAAEVIALPMRP